MLINLKQKPDNKNKVEKKTEEEEEKKREKQRHAKRILW